MEKIMLYTTGCPKCRILEQKLKEKNVNYEICDDIEKMRKIGIMSVPVLMVGEEKMPFYDAVKYVNGL